MIATYGQKWLGIVEHGWANILHIIWYYTSARRRETKSKYYIISIDKDLEEILTLITNYLWYLWKYDADRTSEQGESKGVECLGANLTNLVSNLGYVDGYYE